MKDSIKDKFLVGIITVIMCFFAFVTLVPLINVVAVSLSSKAAVDRNAVNLWPIGLTFASWEYIITDKMLWKSFGISVASTITGVILSLVLTAFMAYPLSKPEFKLGKYMMMLVVGTMILKAPTVPYFLTLRSYGLYNNFWVLVMPHVLSAYNLAIMRTFFKSFPSEIEEAAKIDGCGTIGTLMRIVLPSSKACLASVGLFYGVGMWNQLQTPMLFLNDINLFPLQMRIRQLISSGSDLMTISVRANVNYTEATLSAATVVFALVPVILVYPLLQKYFAQGAMLGSVKG